MMGRSPFPWSGFDHPQAHNLTPYAADSYGEGRSLAGLIHIEYMDRPPLSDHQKGGPRWA